MDFFPGGDLFHQISRRRTIPEKEVKVYTAEIILALNYLHKNNIIYRDLKPENIFIDIDGHLHLGDFGVSKVLENKDKLNHTFCGSPEYMAPELLTEEGYTFTADLYALGMLIYEMITGNSPFMNINQSELFNQIKNQDIRYPDTMPPKLKSLLSQLLTKDPKDRLGSKYGLSEIVNHPWCADIDFVKVASKSAKPVFIPNLYKTYFAAEFTQARISLTNGIHLSNCPQAMSIDDWQYENEKRLGEEKTKFKKFANFSFYSNIEDPYDKYLDSIFDTEDLETYRDHMKVGPLNLKLHKIETTGKDSTRSYKLLEKGISDSKIISSRIHKTSSTARTDVKIGEGYNGTYNYLSGSKFDTEINELTNRHVSQVPASLNRSHINESSYSPGRPKSISSANKVTNYLKAQVHFKPYVSEVATIDPQMNLTRILSKDFITDPDVKFEQFSSTSRDLQSIPDDVSDEVQMKKSALDNENRLLYHLLPPNIEAKGPVISLSRVFEDHSKKAPVPIMEAFSHKQVGESQISIAKRVSHKRSISTSKYQKRRID